MQRVRAGLWGTVLVAAYLALIPITWLASSTAIDAWRMRLGVEAWPPTLDRALVYALGGLCLLAAWLAYWRLHHDGTPAPRRVLVAVMAVALLAAGTAAPFYSNDVLGYMAYGRAWQTWQANPYLVTPGNLAAQDALIALNTGWYDLVAPYGPFWLLLSGTVARWGDGDLWLTIALFRVLSLVGHATAAYLAARLAQRFHPGRGSLVFSLLWLNPLFILESAFNAHNDSVMLALLLLALWGGRQGRAWAWIAGSTAVLVKVVLAPVALLFAVQQVRRFAWYQWGLGFIAAAATALVVYWPFWAWPAVLEAILSEGGRFDTLSVPYLLNRALGWLDVRGVPLPLTPDQFTQLLTLLPFAGVTLWLALRQDGDDTRLLRSSVVLLLWLVILVSVHFRQWYLIWPTTLALVLAPHPLARACLWLTFGATIYYVSPVFADSLALRVLLALIALGYPGWLTVCALWNELRNRPREA